MSPSEGFLFAEKEEVLAYHGPLIYNATVRECHSKAALEGGVNLRLYLLHYDGWHPNWDEWVSESRILKVNDANSALQKERIKEFQRAHKRKLNKADASEVDKRQKSEMPLQDVREALRLPHSMKLKLIEDWERITRERYYPPRCSRQCACWPSVSFIWFDLGWQAR